MARPKGFVDPITYSRNVLRSAKYISVNVLKGINPTLTSMIVDTKSEVKEMIDDIKDGQSGGQKMIKDLFGLAYKTAGDTKRNVLDDIRTGKFYNPEREAKNSEEFAKEWAGLNEFDFDIDFDFEDEDDDKPKARGERSMTQNFNMLSTVQQRMAAASSEEITRNADKNTKNTIMASARLFGQLNNSLAHIYNSVNLLHQDLTEPLNTHIKNSANFYSTATDQLAKQTALLENINKMLTDRFAPPANKFESKQSAYEKIFANGFPSVKGLASHVKTKLFDEGYGGLLTSVMDPDTIKMFASMGINSPIALLLSSVIGGKIRGSSVGRSVDRFTNTLTGGFKMVASRIHKYNKGSWGTDKYGNKTAKNGVLSFLAQIFDTLPDVYDDKKIDSGKYHKDRTDWTGIDSKALTEVIPMQLAKIYAAISGQDAEIFDYQTGKWVKANKLKSNFNKARSQVINDASIGFKSDMVREYIDDMNKAGKPINYSSRATARFSKDFDTVLRTMVIQDVHITDMDDSKFKLYLANMVKKGVIDRRNLEPLKNMFLKHQMRTDSALVDGRIANNKFINNIGATHNVYGAVFNDSNIHKSKNRGKNFYKNTVLGITDDKGNDIFFYLQSYFTQLEDLRNIAIHGGFGGGGKVAPAVSNAVIVNASGQPISTVTTPMPGSSFTSAVVPTNKKAIKRYTKRDKDHQSPGRITDENMYDEWDENKGKRGGWNVADKDKIIEKTKTKKDLKKEEELEKGNPFSRAIDKFTATMKGIFIGKTPFSDIVEERGILGAITALPEMTAKYFQDIFNDFKTTFIDWTKGKWDKFKQTKFAHNFKDGFFEGLGNIRDSLLNHAVESAAGLTQWATGKRPDWAANVITAANGAMINKSGMVSVSEGELIIPSEKNPFYRKKTNKSAQKATEARNYRNWVAGGARPLNYWGSYADGGTVGPEKKKIDNNVRTAIQKLVSRTAKQGGSINISNSSKYFVDKGYAEEDIKREFENAQRRISVGRVRGKIQVGLNSAANNFVNTIFGTKSGNAREYGQEIMDTIKKDKAKTAVAAVAGGLIGGALTGSGIGLLGGAAIGVALDMIKRSDKINTLLFDKQDSDGNVISKGKLPKSIQTFIKKTAPELMKSGGVGAALGAIGAIPGVGVLGGFAIGAGIQLLSYNEKIKNGLGQALFGNKDLNGERHGGIVGMLKTRIIDPIADWVKNGISNAGSYLKKFFFDPLLKIFDPMKDWIKAKSFRLFTGLFADIGHSIKRGFLNVAEGLDATVGRFLGLGGKLSSGILGIGGQILSVPGRILGAVGGQMTKDNIRTGHSFKSVAERLSVINSSKKPEKYGALGEYNKILGGMEVGSDEYLKFMDDVSYFSGGQGKAHKTIKNTRESFMDSVIASLKNGGMGNPGIVSDIRRLSNSKDAKKGDFSQVARYLNDLDPNILDPKMKKLILGDVKKEADGSTSFSGQLGKTATNIQKMVAGLDNFEAERLAFFQAHPEFGAIDNYGKVRKGILRDLGGQADIDRKAFGVWDPNFELRKTEEENAQAIIDEEKEYRHTMADHAKTIIDILMGIPQRIKNAILGGGEEESNSSIDAEKKNENPLGISRGSGLEDEDKKESSWDYNDAYLRNSYAPNDLSGINDKISNKKTVTDGYGNQVKLTNVNGNYKRDDSDATTSATRKDQDAKSSKTKDLVTGRIAGAAPQMQPTTATTDLSGINDKSSGKQTVLDYLGRPIRLIKTMGQIKRDDSDPQTVETTDAQNDELNASKSFFKLFGEDGPLYNGIQKLFGNSDEKKSSIFDTLKNVGSSILSFVSGGAMSALKVLLVGLGIANLPLILNTISSGVTALAKFFGAMSETGEGSTSLIDPVTGEAASKEIVATRDANNETNRLSTGGVILTEDMENNPVSIAESSTPLSSNYIGKHQSVGTKISAWTGYGIGALANLEFGWNGNVQIKQSYANEGVMLANYLNGSIGTVFPYVDVNINGYLVYNKESKALDLYMYNETTKQMELKTPSVTFEDCYYYDYKNHPGTMIAWKRSTKVVTVLIDFQSIGTITHVNSLNHDTGVINITDDGGFFGYGKKTSYCTVSIDTNARTFTLIPCDESGNPITGGRSGLKRLFGGGTNFISQVGNYKKFGNSTIDGHGCGPAAATSVLNMYGINSDINKNADYAISNGYVAGASGVRGTSASYFGDILGRNGINTEYTSSSSKISNSIKSGHPTVLLGQDKSNTSKSNSPFGPNPHYVVARGSDKNGNVIVDDPELNGTAIYDKSILNHAQLGIATGGASAISSKISNADVDSGNVGVNWQYNIMNRGWDSVFTNQKNNNGYSTVVPSYTVATSGGKKFSDVISSSTATTVPTSSTTVANKPANNEEAIWGYFKQTGLSDHAVAGILGNIKHESIGYDPTTVETGFKNRLNKYGNIYSNMGVDISSQEALNRTYTAAVDSGTISKEEFMRPYTIANNPKQFGYGLVQFTSPGLKEELYERAKANKTSVGDLITQLGSVYTQLENAGVMTTLKDSSTTAEVAAEKMLRDYEKPTNIESQVPIRRKSAREIYEKYTGKTFDVTGYTLNSDGTISTGTSSSSFSSSSDSSATGVLGLLTSVFSKIGSGLTNSLTGSAKAIASAIFGSSDTTATDSTSSSYTSSGSYNIDNSVSGEETTGGIAKTVPSDLIGKGTPEAFVKIAQSQLGVVQGNNKYTDYGKFTGTQNAAWCAAFVSWVMNQALGGDQTKLKNVLRAKGDVTGKSASVQILWDRFKADNAFYNTPQVGDLAIYRSDSAQNHIGIVESVNGNNITTVEGNTSGTSSGYSRSGGMVARKSFDITGNSTNAKRLKGFGRPNWAAALSGGFSGLRRFVGGSSDDGVFERNGGVVGRKSFTVGDGSKLDQKLIGFGRPDWEAIRSRNARLASLSWNKTVGAGSGLPIYNFTNRDTAYKAYKAGSSGLSKSDMGSIYDSTINTNSFSALSNEKKLQQILIYLKQIVSNTGYNVSIPEIVDVLKDQADIISNMQSGATVINQGESVAAKDKQTEIETDISKMMAKLDAITQAL